MVTRDFDAMLADAAGTRPTFKVAGQIFTLRARLPFHRWNKLLAAMRAEGADDRTTTETFYRTVLIKADRDRFINLIFPPETANDEDDDDADDVNQIDLAQVDQITDWVMEHFTGKQRTSSGSSPSGSNGTGPQQNRVSLSAVSPGA